MLLTLMYHKIGEGKHANSKKIIEEHFTYIHEKYTTVLPGDKLDLFKINICITFDDAYYDFYHFVFPLLKKFNLRAVLAVPVKYIQEKTDIDTEIRLSVPYTEATKDGIFKKKVPFCTWEELREMSKSGYVQIGNHSYSHRNLLESEIDLDLEAVKSKEILENKLNTKIDTFVYPFGRFNKKTHKFIISKYKYVMRIGSTFNLNWQNFNKMTYRISCDNLSSIDKNFKTLNFLSYILFYFLNTIRGR